MQRKIIEKVQNRNKSARRKPDIFTHFKGALTEQFVLEELTAYGIDPFYWSPDNLRAEIEFLMQLGGDVYPIEVKAGINLKSKSLLSYGERYHPKKSLRLSVGVRTEGAKVSDYPLYAIPEMLAEASDR